jgi:hypothetical protein
MALAVEALLAEGQVRRYESTLNEVKTTSEFLNDLSFKLYILLNMAIGFVLDCAVPHCRITIGVVRRGRGF